MTPPPTPALSVVLSTRTTMRPLAHVWPTLERQTIADRMEVLVVGPAALAAEPPSRSGFADVRVVEVDRVRSVAHAAAAGARAARAPLVAFTEDHVMLDPNWAAALVEAHEDGWAVVGPVVRNADPGSLVGWADFALAYGAFAAPSEGGERNFLSGHNACYRRDVLLARGGRLENDLAAETTFHWDLRREGFRLWLEPRARIAHLDFGQVVPWLAATFHFGRVFAARRAARWSAARRAAFTLASPLVPLVRLSRAWPDGRRAGMPLAALPALLVGLAVDGFAQAVGTALGAGPAEGRLVDYEYERIRFARRAMKRTAPSAAPAAPDAK